MMDLQEQVLDFLQLERISKQFLSINKFLLIFSITIFFYSSVLQSKEIRITADKDNIEELLKLDPNNVDFLFIYAKKKEELNEYELAEKIYKRIISLRPNELRFYLDLARVQFLRFDYINSEKNFLYIYKKKNIPKNVKYNIRNYLKMINRNKSGKVNYTVKLSRSDNINNGTYADSVKLFGVPFKIDENAKAKSSYELFTNINGSIDKSILGQKINAGFDISNSDFKSKIYDRLKYGVNIGPEFIVKNKKINLDYSFSQEKIGFSKVLNSNQLMLKSFHNKKNSQFEYIVGIDNKSYYNNSNYNSDGNFVELRSNFFFKDRFSLGANYRYTKNDALKDFYGNEKNYFELTSSANLLKNYSFNLSTGIEISAYDKFQPIFSKTRKDYLRFINLTIRNDKFFIGNYMPQLSLTYRENNSNVSVYETKSDNISFYLVKEF